ncbi:hypothetical protein NKG05_21605 [Oerskovia sp. M15]
MLERDRQPRGLLLDHSERRPVRLGQPVLGQARRRGAYEPWHFEFTEGVIEHGGLT